MQGENVMMSKEKEDHLGTRIRKGRVKKSYTQEILAEKIGVTQGYISELERGNELPGRDLLFRLSECLDITTDYLCNGDTQTTLRNLRIEKIMKWLDNQDEETQDLVIGYIESLKDYLENKK